MIAANPMLGATDQSYGVGVWVSRVAGLRSHLRIIADNLPEDAKWLRRQVASALCEAERYMVDQCPDTYRGWTISQGRWPEPAWSATGPNYDASYEGEEDGSVGNGEAANAPTRAALIAEIDAWFEENAA